MNIAPNSSLEENDSAPISDEHIESFVHRMESLTDADFAEAPHNTFQKRKYFKDLLNLNDWSVEQLAIQPGEPYFEFWFLVSSYFPLVVGTLGPMSNLTNIISLIDSWRVNKVTGEKVKDYPWLLKLNGISVMFALISNISLLMNTRDKMRYTTSQVISIAGWFIAATILLVLVIVGHYEYFHETEYVPSQGFWFALFTVVLYYFCFAVLVMNESGFLLKKYPPIFNIDGVQKNLMVLVIILMIFLICGSAAFASLMNTHFADAMYFVVVTILTVGLGDFVPYNAGGKVLILFYSVVGLLLLALIISTIRELVIFSAASTFAWHRIEQHRSSQLKSLNFKNVKLSSEESFNLMMAVDKKSILSQKTKSLITILSVFTAFWLIGAVVFCKAESWDYGTACYFCFLCLVTIGYGVPSPTSPAGRAFFVLWGLGAVPLMTMLISNMSDILFASLKDTNNYSLLDPFLELFSNVVHKIGSWMDKARVYLHNLFSKKEEENSESPTEKDSDSAQRSILEEGANEAIGIPLQELPPDASKTAREIREVLEMTRLLRKMIVVSIENPNKKFSHEEWREAFIYSGDDQKLEKDNFWLSEESPFRFPFMQCHFFEFKYLLTIEQKLKNLMEETLNDDHASDIPSSNAD